MRKKSLFVAGLLVVALTGGRTAAAQDCQTDDDKKIHAAILSKYGPHFEQPDVSFSYRESPPNLDGLRNLGKNRGEPGYEVKPLGNPGYSDDLVSYIYSVKQRTSNWRLHISTVGKYAVLQQQIDTRTTAEIRYTAPIVSRTNTPGGRIVGWLLDNGYSLLRRKTLECPTSYRTLARGDRMIGPHQADRIRFWQMLFRIELGFPW